MEQDNMALSGMIQGGMTPSDKTPGGIARG